MSMTQMKCCITSRSALIAKTKSLIKERNAIFFEFIPYESMFSLEWTMGPLTPFLTNWPLAKARVCHL